MAKKRAVKKTGKKAPTRKGGHKKQAKKPVGRKAPAGSGKRARKKTVRARKATPQAGAAAPATSPNFGRPEGEPQDGTA
jgi:hypothetical protein